MLVLPAIHVKHAPLLRRLLYARRINDRLYIDCRLPLWLGRIIAAWLASGPKEGEDG